MNTPFYVLINKYRVFPRLMLFFMMFMMWVFHDWFTQSNTILITEISEWALLGYASVLSTFVGFAKFYMENRNAKADNE